MVDFFAGESTTEHSVMLPNAFSSAADLTVHGMASGQAIQLNDSSEAFKALLSVQ